MTFAVDALAATAPAKLNLALHVVGRRPDGYHLIESLSVFSRLGDRVSVGEANADSFAVDGPFADAVPDGPDNLVLRARDALRSAFPGAGRQPVAISLHKALPVMAGIGGGSSDAAATLKLLARLWGIRDAGGAMERVAIGLGADVPMCLEGRPLLARGIGENLTPIGAFPRLNVVLVNPGAGVATPRVFAELARRENPPLPAMPARLGYDDLLAWLRKARNDLTDAALRVAPSIGEALQRLDAVDADLARMSGSGATCFGLFRNRATAQRAATAIAALQPDWFVEATETV